MDYVFVLINYYAYYITFEVIFNALARRFKWYNLVNEKRPLKTMEGTASIYVGIVGAVSGMGSYLMQKIPIFGHWWFIPIFSIIVGAIITINEFFFGWIYNKVFKLGLWDYSNEKFNIFGLITLYRSIGWIFIGTVTWFANQQFN